MAYISFQPNDFFSTTLYTGTGSTQTISGESSLLSDDEKKELLEMALQDPQ